MPTPTDGLKSSLVLLWKAKATASELVAMVIAPYRTVGKPASLKPCANQIGVRSLTGDQSMRPSSGSSVALVPGWLTRRVGALNGELIVACNVRLAPGPPLLVSRYSRYPVP